MSDFEYDSYDSSTLKVAFQNLRKAEQEGFWLGIGAGFPLGFWLVTRKSISHKISAGPITKTFSSLIFGSLMYNKFYEATEPTFLEPDSHITMLQEVSIANIHSSLTKPSPITDAFNTNNQNFANNFTQNSILISRSRSPSSKK